MADAFCKECGIDVVFDSTKTDGFGTPEQYCTACESRLNAEWVEQRSQYFETSYYYSERGS